MNVMKINLNECKEVDGQKVEWAPTDEKNQEVDSRHTGAA